MTTPEELREALRAATQEAGLPLLEPQLELAVAHGSLLVEANRRTNLTRITAPAEVARRHFVESFLAAELWGDAPAGRLLRLLDVGAGGGFPGLAGRILRDDAELVCLEPRAAKAAFLARVAAGLGEPRPQVRTRRLEEFHVEQPFDVVTFRALHVDVGHVERVLAPGGRIVGFPGGEETWSAALEAAGWSRVASRALPGGLREVVAWLRTD